MNRTRARKQSDASVVAEELLEWDARTFGERVERWTALRKLTDPPPNGWCLPGDLITASAWWEAGRSFVAGNFIATVTLTQGFVERSLFALLAGLGKVGGQKPGFARLIDDAVAAGVLSEALAARLHELRRLRNPYVHAEADSWPPKFVERAWTQAGGDPYAVTSADARSAIETGAIYIRGIIRRWKKVAREPRAASFFVGRPNKELQPASRNPTCGPRRKARHAARGSRLSTDVR